MRELVNENWLILVWPPFGPCAIASVPSIGGRLAWAAASAVCPPKAMRNTNKQASRALGCNERTIKAHRHRVIEKMQVQSLAELVSLAERVGVLAPAAGQTPLGISNRQVPLCEDRSPPR